MFSWVRKSLHVIANEYEISEKIMFTDVLTITDGALKGQEFVIVDDDAFKHRGGVLTITYYYRWPMRTIIMVTQHNGGNVRKAQVIPRDDINIVVERIDGTEHTLIL